MAAFGKKMFSAKNLNNIEADSTEEVETEEIEVEGEGKEAKKEVVAFEASVMAAFKK